METLRCIPAVVVVEVHSPEVTPLPQFVSQGVREAEVSGSSV